MKNSRVVSLSAGGLGVALGLSLAVLLLNLARTASAAEPISNSARIAGLASNPIRCLATGEAGGQSAGEVWLAWRGRVDRVQLVLAVSAAQVAHTVKVNGHSVTAPAYPDGESCRDGDIFYVDVPPEAVVQGRNRIELTSEGLAGDAWTAANVRLMVLGDLETPGRGSLEAEGTMAVAAQGQTLIVSTTNSYDGSSQNAAVVVPNGYVSGIATPLLVAVHGRSSNMFEGTDTFSAAVESRTWLLISPEMHGSWPPPPPVPITGTYAYASLESQYDVVGAVAYMLQHYTVDPARIYLYGGSMGGQIATVTGAKYPHLFAAVFDNKGATDMTEWYSENLGGQRGHMREECHINGIPQTPTGNPFCYQRRSSLNFARNLVHVPITMTHSISDTLVPIHHSYDLRDAINSFGPDQPAAVAENSVGACGGTSETFHCYDPDPLSVLDYFTPFRLNNTPTSIRITSDESKSYYWLNVAQTGSPHFTQADATYYPVTRTVVAAISDAQTLTLGFNLGSAPAAGIIPQPGLGLPPGTYRVTGGGNDYLQVYTSGYFTVTLNTTGQSTLTISLLTRSLYLPLVRR